jgi:lipopolysaccharide biosynthesis regulator YciM
MGEKHSRELYAGHLEKHPSLIAATRLLADATLEPAQQPQVLRALEHAAKPLRRYRCAACGFEALQHFWHCPGCQAWDSYPPRRVEEL